MPFRFRKSIKVAPGVKVNLGKRGTSVTVGGKGFHQTYGHGQTRTTVGLPGTGLSYTNVRSRRKQQAKPPAKPTPTWAYVVSTIFVLGLVTLCIFVCIIPVVSGLLVTSPSGNTPVAASNPTRTSTPLSTKTPTPKPKPTATPKPCPHPAVNGNPWCYTFTNTGKLITNPPPDFCTYFNCISSFANGSGYVVECANGQYSKSGGHVGVCSKQGGFKRNLYAP